MNRGRLLRLVLVSAACFASMGCASSLHTPGGVTRGAQLVVHNSNTRDVNLYVMNGTMRVRIGTARSMATSQLTIPAVYLTRPDGVVLLADPIGSAATYTFPAMQVAINDRVELQVGNALALSSFGIYTR
jgi:hypothetical protein